MPWSVEPSRRHYAIRSMHKRQTPHGLIPTWDLKTVQLMGTECKWWSPEAVVRVGRGKKLEKGTQLQADRWDGVDRVSQESSVCLNLTERMD